MSDNPFEIPQSMRDVAEQNMKQAHAAFDQLSEFVSKTMSAWRDAIPTNSMAAGFKDVQDSAMNFANDNAESAFAKLTRLAGSSVAPVFSAAFGFFFFVFGGCRKELPRATANKTASSDFSFCSSASHRSGGDESRPVVSSTIAFFPCSGAIQSRTVETES